jgi:hypothetical protein
MNQQVAIFAQKHMGREIQEGVPYARRIALTIEGQPIERWEPVSELDPGQWCEELRTLLDQLADELPKKRCQVVLTAEDVNGGTLGQCLTNVQGRNASIQDLGTQNGAKALSDAMQSTAKTMDSVLKMARDMMDFQAGQLEKYAKQNHDFVELFQALQKIQVDDEKQESAVSALLLEHVKEASPLIMALAQKWLESPGSGLGRGIGNAVAAAATNGKAVVQ